MNKALLDTGIYSEVLKAVNPTVASNAAQYRQQHSVYSLSVISVVEVVTGFDAWRAPTASGARQILIFG